MDFSHTNSVNSPCSMSLKTQLLVSGQRQLSLDSIFTFAVKAKPKMADRITNSIFILGIER